MSDTLYDITHDPEANVLYEKCADVDVFLWEALAASDPAEIHRRTGATFNDGTYQLPFLAQSLTVTPTKRRVTIFGDQPREPEFQLCLVCLLYLLKVDVHHLDAAQISPKEFKGGSTFFQGPHALPVARLVERFGRDRTGFLEAAGRLAGRPLPLGDAAVLLTPFPGVEVGVILWEGDEEFPPRVNLLVPQGLDRFWPLDAVWALLNVVTREILRAAV